MDVVLTDSVARVAAVSLGLTFAVSGMSKLRDPRGFVLGVLEYDVLPRRVAFVYGRVLPFGELACGSALLMGIWPATTALASAGFLATFLVAVSVNVARGRRIDCHCFGPSGGEPVGWVTVARLIFFLACGALVAESDPRPLSVPDSVPVFLGGVGVAVSLYLQRAVPVLWRIWRTAAVPNPTPTGWRVSLRYHAVGRLNPGPHPAGAVHVEEAR